MTEKATLLIVDQDKVLVDLLVRVWSSQHVSVLGCTSADEASRLVDVRVPDLLVLEPSITNGFSLIAAVGVASAQRTRVIGFTTSAEVRARALAAGVETIVDRNRGLDAIAAAVQKTLKMRLKSLAPMTGGILVVDDSDEIRGLLSELLSNRGYTVAGTNSGHEAVRRVQSDPNIHVVLLDIMMPDMSGLEVLEEIMRLEKHPAVIMITAVVDREVARKALKAGASDYILKPFDFAVIDASIVACTSERSQPWWKKRNSGSGA